MNSKERLLESYDYELPADRIAQHPLKHRADSRLMALWPSRQTFSDHHFYDLPELLKEGDLLVLNNTRVIPARLRISLGEVLLVREVEHQCWDALVFPGKHFKPGTRIDFGSGCEAVVLSQSQIGRILRFQGDVWKLMEEQGKMPLPPYVEREVEEEDKERYQTIYARNRGSVAAPTAGLHFTKHVLTSLRKKGIQIAQLTLHVGPGTFRPVKSSDITEHTLHSEFYRCSPKTFEQIQNAGRVIAVGTTTTRAIETIAATGELHGFTSLFIYPGYQFRCVKGLVTNFHLPKSSLLMLVSALAGYDLTRKAYEHAVQTTYRFYSYGDAMVIL